MTTEFTNFENINAPCVHIVQMGTQCALVWCFDTICGHFFASKWVSVREQWPRHARYLRHGRTTETRWATTLLNSRCWCQRWLIFIDAQRWQIKFLLFVYRYVDSPCQYLINLNTKSVITLCSNSKLPKNVEQMYSDIWFPDLLDSLKCDSSLFSIRLNCRAKKRH